MATKSSPQDRKKVVNEKPQGQKFIETARALGCDESEEGFAKKLKAISSVKPTAHNEVKKKAKKK